MRVASVALISLRAPSSSLTPAAKQPHAPHIGNAYRSRWCPIHPKNDSGVNPSTAWCTFGSRDQAILGGIDLRPRRCNLARLCGITIKTRVRAVRQQFCLKATQHREAIPRSETTSFCVLGIGNFAQVASLASCRIRGRTVTHCKTCARGKEQTIQILHASRICLQQKQPPAYPSTSVISRTDFGHTCAGGGLQNTNCLW